MTGSELVRNILGGTSQQPEDQRGANQAKEAKNIFFDPVEGAGKRFPSNHVKTLSGFSQPTKHLFPMDRDDQQYLIWVGDGEINAYQTDGTEVPVVDTTNAAGAYTPLASTLQYFVGGDRDTLRSQVIVDTAFVVNTTVTTSMDISLAETTKLTPNWRQVSTQTPGWGANHYANVFIRQFNWSSKVKIRWKTTGMSEGKEVEYSSPANFTSRSSAPTWNASGYYFSHTSNYTVPYSGNPAAAFDYNEGWYLDYGNFSTPGTPPDMPCCDSENQIYAHTAGDTKESASTWRFGAFTFDPATRMAKLRPGETQPTTPFALHFGWNFEPDPDLDGNRCGGPVSSPATVVRYARSAPIRADYVAEILKERMKAMTGNGISSITPDTKDSSGASWFQIEFSTPVEYFEVVDNVDNTYATGWVTEVEEITDLPLTCRHGSVARVTGLDGEADGAYYVTFQTEKFLIEDKVVADDWQAFDHVGRGTWVEFVPGRAFPDIDSDKQYDTFDKTTMPHVIRRTTVTSAMMADPGFTGNWPDATLGSICFEAVPYDSWDRRTVGDDENNKIPSFIGSKITDIFFWQGRLGFLADDNIILSEAGNTDNFWRTTQLSVPDKDRIDVSATENQGKALRYAVPLDERLIVFSDDMQIVLTSNGLLSPNSVEAPVASKYQSLKNAPPILMGQSLIFPFKNHEYAGLRELVPLDNRDRFSGIELTDWVSRWITAGTSHKLEASTSENLLFFHSNGDPNALYVFSYVKAAEGEYKMAAWSNWEFGMDIHDFTLVDDNLYVIFDNRVGETALERIDLGPGQTDPDVEHPSGDNYRFQVHIDRKYFWEGPLDPAVTAVWTDPGDGGAGYTTFTFSTDDGMYMGEKTFGLQVYDITGKLIEEYDTGGANPDGVDYKAVGDLTAGDIYFGVPYEMRWVANRVNPRVPSSGGSSPRLGRRAINNSAVIGFDRTGYFDVTVTYHTGSSFTTTFDGDASNNRSFGTFDQYDNVSTDPIRTGSIRVPIHGSNQNVRFVIKTSDPYPCRITTLEWTTKQNPKHSLRGVW